MKPFTFVSNKPDPIPQKPNPVPNPNIPPGQTAPGPLQPVESHPDPS